MATKRKYVIMVEAMNTIQLARFLLSISQQINDGDKEATVPTYWSLTERKA